MDLIVAYIDLLQSHHTQCIVLSVWEALSAAEDLFTESTPSRIKSLSCYVLVLCVGPSLHMLNKPGVVGAFLQSHLSFNY